MRILLTFGCLMALNGIHNSFQPPVARAENTHMSELDFLVPLAQGLQHKPPDQVNAWAQQNKGLADRLLQELTVDRYGSKWVGLPPQYPVKIDFIERLAAARGYQATACLNVSPEQFKTLCPEYPGAAEVDFLWQSQQFYEATRVKDLFAQGATMSFSSREFKLSSRGALHLNVLWGTVGNVYEQRWDYLETAFHQAQAIGAKDLLLLIRMGQIELLSIDESSLSKSPEERQRLIAQWQHSALFQQTPGHRHDLQIRNALLQHQLKQLATPLMQQFVQQRLNLIQDPYQKEYYKLLYLDQLTAQGIETADDYFQQFRATEYFKQPLLQRLLAMHDPVIEAALLKQFDALEESEDKAELSQVFLEQKNYQRLYTLFEKAQQPEVKKGYLKVLLSHVNNADFPLIYLRQVLPLAETSQDPDLRKLIAYSALNQDRPDIEETVLHWVHTPYADLRTVALWKADALNRKDYVAYAVKDLNTQDEALLSACLTLLANAGNKTQIPAVRALLPHQDPHIHQQIENTLSRLEGIDAFLEILKRELLKSSPKAEGLYQELLLLIAKEQVQPVHVMPVVTAMTPEQQAETLRVLQGNKGLSDPHFQPLLLPYLNAESPDTQMYALLLLDPNTKSPELIKGLERIARSSVSPNNAMALERLAQVSLGELKVLLSELPPPQDEELKQTLLRCLQNSPELILDTSYLLHDKDPDISAAALNIALKHNTSRTRRLIAPLLRAKHFHYYLKLRIIYALAQHPDPAFLTDLASVLDLNESSAFDYDSDYLYPEIQISSAAEAVEADLETPLMLLKARAIQAIIKISDHPEAILTSRKRSSEVEKLIRDLLSLQAELK